MAKTSAYQRACQDRLEAGAEFYKRGMSLADSADSAKCGRNNLAAYLEEKGLKKKAALLLGSEPIRKTVIKMDKDGFTAEAIAARIEQEFSLSRHPYRIREYLKSLTARPKEEPEAAPEPKTRPGTYQIDRDWYGAPFERAVTLPMISILAERASA